LSLLSFSFLVIFLLHIGYPKNKEAAFFVTTGLRANLVGISIYQQTNACKPIILKYINIKT